MSTHSWYIAAACAVTAACIVVELALLARRIRNSRAALDQPAPGESP